MRRTRPGPGSFPVPEAGSMQVVARMETPASADLLHGGPDSRGVRRGRLLHPAGGGLDLTPGRRVLRGSPLHRRRALHARRQGRAALHQSLVDPGDLALTHGRELLELLEVEVPDVAGEL